MKQKKVLLGSHISIEGGIYKALLRAAEINCTAMQIFTSSSRQWGTKTLTQKEIDLFLKTQKETGIEPISHCSYLINLASSKAAVRKKSYTALKQEILRCNALKIPYAVLHPGSRLDATIEEAVIWVAEALDGIIKESDKTTMILLETMAGQGSTIGGKFEELASIRSHCTQKKYIGICADTAHMFSMGYDFRTENTYKTLWKEFDDTIGLSHLKVIHMNDSKKECGSHVDRHEAIGQGEIGKRAFSFIMNDSKLKTVAKILETPKADLSDDKKNMEVLLGLIKK